MYDSYGKYPPDGMFFGNFWAPGSPSSCLEVEAGDGVFAGRYCSTSGYPIFLKDALDFDGDHNDYGRDARKAPPVLQPELVNKNPVSSFNSLVCNSSA